jgi:hypothetical protein
MYALKRAMTGLMASAAIERRKGSADARMDPPALFKRFRRLKGLFLMRRDY